MTEPIALAQFRVQVDDVFLVHARFLDPTVPSEPTVPVPRENPVNLSLAFHRHAIDKLTVALSATAGFEQPYRLEVIYAGTFSLSDEVPSDEVEESWRRCAAQVAPLVLYPFIRETMANLSSRSRAEAFILPIIAFQGLDPDTVRIPKVPRSPRRRKRPTDESETAE